MKDDYSKIDESVDDFSSMFGDVTPIRQDKVIGIKASHNGLASQLKRQAIEKSVIEQSYHLSDMLNERLDPHASIAFKKDGVQSGVFKKLRLGKYPIETRLWLPYDNINKTKSELVTRLPEYYKMGLRCVLIRQGSKHLSVEKRVELRSYLNQWLRCFPFVIAFHSAQPNHGGLEATYLLLKKHPEEKMKNRAQFRK
jgi:DNA-nicking Smr family endonuclease